MVGLLFVCKIPLLARAAARPSARAMIGYLVYKVTVKVRFPLNNVWDIT